MKIAVVTATKIEFNAVARALRFPQPNSSYGFRAISSNEHGLEILIILSGIGPDRARKSAQQLLLGSTWDVIISSGFAGDLDTGPIGSVLIGTEVCSEPCTTSQSPITPPQILCDPDWVHAALSLNWTGQASLRAGRFVSVDRVLTHSTDKRTLKTSTGAVGVDMESGAIGEVAQGHGFPFLIVRTISDGANEDLPVDFNLFLKPSGWLFGVIHILSTPKSWKGFFVLYRNSKQASQQLTRFFQEFFPSVSTRTFSSNS